MCAKSKFIKFQSMVIALAALMFSGCATAPATIDTSPEAEVTFDGLHPVVGGSMDQAWARADFDLSGYSKVMVQGAGVEFRPGGEKRRMRDIGPAGHYAVTVQQKERFREQMGTAFLDELSKSENFTIVDEAGPDVLLVRGGLLDVVSYVPPEPVGRSEIYLSRIGEATLVLEIRDSVSDAILLRAVDRRAAEQLGGQLSNSNTVTNSSEFRRVARRWAGLLRDGLDRFMVPEEVAAE
jgi:hypothetical protein